MLKNISWAESERVPQITQSDALPLGRTTPNSTLTKSEHHCTNALPSSEHLLQPSKVRSINCTFCYGAKQQNDALQLLWPNTNDVIGKGCLQIGGKKIKGNPLSWGDDHHSRDWDQSSSQTSKPI